MNRFVGEVERAIVQRGLMADGQTVLVAVSGGIDSVVLLEVLHRLSGRHDWALIVAHFNHQLRGRESKKDEAFVRALADERGLPFVVGRANVRRRAKAGRLSIEMAAREARHAFLAAQAARRAAGVIAVGHQADDQVELFLWRLLRGAGSEGLGGMKWSGRSPNDSRFHLVRPLLGQARTKIAAFARSQTLAFREDSSNESADFLRNRIRHQLIPTLRRKYQPGLTAVVLRQAEILGSEASFIEDEVSRWRAQPKPSPLKELPVALQRRVIVEELIRLGQSPDFEWVEALRRSNGRPVQIAHYSVVLEDSGRLSMVEIVNRVVSGRQTAAKSARGSQTRVVALNRKQGVVEWGGYRVVWQIYCGQKPDVRARTPGREWFDADRVGRTVILRNRRAGDRYQPLGLPRSARLQNLLVNARIPRERRPELLLAANESGTIWWVDGLRIGEDFQVGPQTRRFLQWKWSLK